MNTEWKLVPVEPSDEMVATYWDCARLPMSDAEFPRAIYRAMLNAAPPAPTSHPIPTGATGEDGEKVYHFEQRSRFGPWIEVEKPTAKSVEFVKRSDAPAAGDALAWQGLTDAERDGYVGELADYGTDFVAPLYAVVESIERRLRDKNAAIAQQKGEA